MAKLHIIIASTRPGRVGLAVGEWFFEVARMHEGFDVELVDLAEVDLPMFNEAAHPMRRQYEHEHTKAWSEKIDSADAFVIVTPEYNHYTPPALVNALNYLYKEWNYKPVGFVSYGGVSGGLRSAEMTKVIVTTLKMMPMVEAVTIQFVAKHIDETRRFVPLEAHIKSANEMLVELLRWADALKPLRSS